MWLVSFAADTWSINTHPWPFRSNRGDFDDRRIQVVLPLRHFWMSTAASFIYQNPLYIYFSFIRFFFRSAFVWPGVFSLWIVHLYECSRQRALARLIEFMVLWISSQSLVKRSEKQAFFYVILTMILGEQHNSLNMYISIMDHRLSSYSRGIMRSSQMYTFEASKRIEG